MSITFPPSPGGRRIAAGIILGLAAMAPLAAQNRLYVFEPDNKYHLVAKVREDRPLIMADGQLVAGHGQRYALKKNGEYLPVFIAVQDMEAMSTAQRSLTVGVLDLQTFNNEFHFRAKFESAEPLEDVFLVLELEFANVSPRIFVYEVGRLEARKPKPFSTITPLGQYLGTGKLTLHLFVAGTEVFHSEQPAAYREEMLDRMIATRIAGVQQGALTPFYGSAPAYPRALRQTGAKGQAVVTMRVSPRGAVLDPVVASATDPAFGEAALAAIRQCRFLPRVQDGRAVEVPASITFAFEPDKGAADGKN